MERILYGRAHVVDWKGQVRYMKKSILSSRSLGLPTLATHCAIEGGGTSRPKPDQKMSESLPLISLRVTGPRDHLETKQLRWIGIQTATLTPPPTSGNTVLVEKSLCNLPAEGVRAQVHETWPLTLYDIDPRILRMLGPLMPTLVRRR